jgi:hypothetical protein
MIYAESTYVGHLASIQRAMHSCGQYPMLKSIPHCFLQSLLQLALTFAARVSKMVTRVNFIVSECGKVGGAKVCRCDG